METPPLVEERLDGESVRARVGLGGNDAAFVTPTRTLVYRSEGLLSDEDVREYGHQVDRAELDTGRRKATVRLIGIEGTESFSMDASRIGDLIEPMLAGVLAQSGVIEEMEAVEAVYRFSELTLVITDARVLKHVGAALWDDDHESFPFANVTGLDTEDGSHATGLVLDVDGRSQRVKIPSDEARVVVRAVEDALLSYHGVSSLAALRERADVDEDSDTSDTAAGFDDPNIPSLVGDDPAEAGPSATASAGGNPEGSPPADDPVPLLDESGRDSNPESGAGSDPESSAGSDPDPDAGIRGDDAGRNTGGADGTGEAGSAAAGSLPDLHDRVDALEAELDRQTELLERQGELIEQLIEELRRGR
jgi:hypothetical protein